VTLQASSLDASAGLRGEKARRDRHAVCKGAHSKFLL